ncbi:MAG TPA: hypothetical protein VMS18_05665 [Candidatus Binatia bacterium]|nr:hypothetical protein [Candidatus Binatia bacterium]
MFRVATLPLCMALMGSLPALAQEDGKDKNVDVRSPVGDLHVGKDADAQKAGLPIYPGARPQHTDRDEPLNLALSTEKFGMKLIVAKYETDDSSEKVLAFYREKMKRYGRVLECHNTGDHSGFHSDDDQKEGSQELRCEGDNSGPVRELKVGTEDNQHIVALEEPKGGKVTPFVIVYLRKHEKGDI